MGVEWLWVAFTLAAAAMQTARNTLQRGLIQSVGALGAAHARFLYGLPFAVLFLAALSWMRGVAPPLPGPDTVLWAAAGGLAQIAATALMLSAMRSSSFLLSIAYTKCEPVLVLLFGRLVLGETLGPVKIAAICVATAGVMLMSWPARERRGSDWVRPVLHGLGAGGLFALSAVCFRGGIVGLGDPDPIMAACSTLVLSLLIQTVALSLWMAWREPDNLARLLRRPLAALPAGLMGAAASLFWFSAFALQSSSLVRTLALVEILFAQVVTRRFIREAVTAREYAGIAALCLGLVAIFLG